MLEDNTKVTAEFVRALTETPARLMHKVDLSKYDAGSIFCIETKHGNHYYIELVTPGVPTALILRRYGSQTGALSRGSLQLQTLERMIRLGRRLTYKDSRRKAKTGTVQRIWVLTMTEFKDPVRK